MKKQRPFDLEEIRPQHFFIHNKAVCWLLRSEGTITGTYFELTGWRRDGLLARVRQQGFTVLTLHDQIEQLPRLRPAPPIGPACLWPSGRSERYSYFDPSTRTWNILPDAQPGQTHISLHAGWIIRRRRGRGEASYYRVFCERSGSAGIAPLDETAALLLGYAQAALLAHAPLPVPHNRQGYRLPDLPLPPPYRQVLERIGQHSKQTGWQVNEQGWPLARLVYERLAIRLADSAGGPQRD